MGFFSSVDYMIIVQNLYLRKRKCITDKENANWIGSLCLKTKIYVTFQKETQSVEKQSIAGSKPASGISSDPHTSQSTLCCKKWPKKNKKLWRKIFKEKIWISSQLFEELNEIDLYKLKCEVKIIPIL